MFVDLHLHTSYSDGSYTPRKLIQKAEDIGYSAIAITDHDTIKGIFEAVNIANNYNLEIVPGIEFNTSYQDIDIHILGYFIDIKNNELISLLEKIKKERRDRIKKIIKKLKDLYNFDLSLEEIKEISENNIMGRSHIARILTEKGYVKKWEEVFDKYIKKGQPAYVSRNKITPFEAVDIIKKADGIPVIAHPGLIENKSIITKLINYGVRGIEAIYLEHTKSQIEYFKRLAQKNELLITGGSDCHGPYNKEGVRLGKIRLDYRYLEELKKYNRIVNDEPFKKDLLS